ALVRFALPCAEVRANAAVQIGLVTRPFPASLRRDAQIEPRIEGAGADVSVGLSLAMTAAFLGLCLIVVWWIFRTGYRLKT
ncbi:MAG TPA: hypothetical protein VEK73_07415, partial [Xanthobacteraceae bacterium]|nr:hypothetical protein [Xanthobacteraceae bacterium]